MGARIKGIFDRLLRSRSTVYPLPETPERTILLS
jgi:hypothetical protein